MSFLDNLMLKLDQTITSILGDWDIYTTTILASIIVFVAYQVFTARDPDSHPILLARQAQASPVRQSGESAVFRSHSAPHGIPLNSGLNVKDEGAPKWTRGRDGDLRDIWRKVLLGATDGEGRPIGVHGKIYTVLGSQQVNEHQLEEVKRHINAIGLHIKKHGGQRVAIYLPNSIEFLAALFACAFYDMTAVLVPFEQPTATLVSLLQKARADTVIAPAGSFSFTDATRAYPALSQLIWVVDEGNAHMDWDEVQTGTGGLVDVSTWQEITQDQDTASTSELPVSEKNRLAQNIITFSPTFETVEYTQANLIAGIAGQLTSVPTTQRIVPTDLLIPADTLSSVYTLVLTLAALHSNASLALNSVANPTTDLHIATVGISPTLLIASPTSLTQLHAETTAKLNSRAYNLLHWMHTRTLVQNGVMPAISAFSRAYDTLRPKLGTTKGKLRLIFVPENAAAGSTPLTSEILSDLRIFTGARIIYALTSPLVAGAVSQTAMYDYRVDAAQRYAHVGVPVTSVEVLFRDTRELTTTDERAEGEIVVRGPAVVGGEAALGLMGRLNHDYTIALLR